ncbi:unnamed protein product, partial [Chrysoparadoxa australica]
ATIYDHSEETLKFVQTIALLEVGQGTVSSMYAMGFNKRTSPSFAIPLADCSCSYWHCQVPCDDDCHAGGIAYFGCLGLSAPVPIDPWNTRHVSGSHKLVSCRGGSIHVLFHQHFPESMPSLLFWLRYSLFLVLYPSGISGEILIMLEGMRSPCMNETKLLGVIEPYYLCILALAIYVPGAPFMISNMWANRKRSFSKFFGKQKKGD